jgi:hypothetical protein
MKLQLVYLTRNYIAKPGQEPLVDLDQFRYALCPKRFRLDIPKREAMAFEDVVHLVEWKL